MREGLLQFLLWPFRRFLAPLRLLWRGLGRLGIALRRLLTGAGRLLWTRLLRPPWRLLRRLGISLRRLLSAIGRPIWNRLLLPFWRFLGRLGLALRRLLTLFIWRPIRFMARPWWLLYWRYLHRPAMRLLRALLLSPFWLLRQGARGAGWLFVRPVRLSIQGTRRRWREGYPGRARWRREQRTRVRVWQARMRVALLRPQPPRKAIVAPAAPRVVAPPPVRRRSARRLVTTGLAAGLVVAASLFTAQQAPKLRGAAAENEYQISSSKFVTVTPTDPAPAATATAPASPTPLPTQDPLNGGGSVLFTLRQSGNSDLYALGIGQSAPVRLTNDPADDRDPAWSPDGQEIAFASRRDGNWEIYILRLKDGAVRRMTDDLAFDGGPSWSPDGQWLVFESYRSGSLDLYLMSADGQQGPLRLTQHPAPDFAPVWSPGGRHIAFTSWRSGNKDIFILSLDDAVDERAYNVTGTPGQHEDNPAFSPDGAKLAYDEDSSGRHLVYSLPLANYVAGGQPVSYGQGQHPSWSPDGQALTFYDESAGRYHLFSASLDAWSVAPRSFSTEAVLSQPSWSPDRLPRPLPETLQAISQSSPAPLFQEPVAPASAAAPPYLLHELPVNAPAPYLSDRVDQSFLVLRERVMAEAGWDFLGELDQMYEAIDAQALPGQSSQTWNKAGRAFDYLSDYALAFDPAVEVARERAETSTYWRTYLRTAAQDGTQGEPLRDMPWDFRARFGAESRYYDEGGKTKEQIPVGYYVDFTALAADCGWARSPASDNWRTYYPGIGYWHYENQQGLTWEQAMLELFTADQILSVFRR
jgi:TolB protein